MLRSPRGVSQRRRERTSPHALNNVYGREKDTRATENAAQRGRCWNRRCFAEPGCMPVGVEVPYNHEQIAQLVVWL